MKEELHLEKGIIPIFCKARTIIYSLRTAVNEELQRLQDEFIIKPLTISKWASSTVSLFMCNDKFPKCVDFKVTVKVK